MTSNTPTSIWTEPRVEQLKADWADGLSASQIAVDLGAGITRNAVIGKVNRLGLGERRTTTPIVRRKRAERTIRKNGAGFVPIDTDDEPLEADVSSLAVLESQTPPATFLGIALLNLESKHCRYPRTVDGATLFCGQPKTEGSAYCADCHRRCHSRERYSLNVRRAA